MLKDVAIIRPLLIVLLVFYHAFAPYSGAWPSIEGCPEVQAYWWLDKLSFAFILEMFVFISGYVFGYQVRMKGEQKLKAKGLLWNKFKRLIVPSMIFSLLYIILLLDITQPIAKTLYGVVNGVGHMWFLPMLFWCFVGVWAIEKSHANHTVALIGLLALSLVPMVNLPLRLSATMYYLFFFYSGYVLQRDGVDMRKLETPKTAVALTLSFVVFFPLLTLLKESVVSLGLGENHLIIRALQEFIKHVCKVLYSSLGIAMMLSIIRLQLNRRHRPIPEWAMFVGKLSMGVYLFQQFVLKGLYNYTSLPATLGAYMLPWIGFAVAMAASLALSWVMSQSRAGRFVLGG